MKRTLATCTLLLGFLGFAAAPVSAELQIGDNAPSLQISEWVQGESIDLAKDASKKIHMIEFWAVWCPPCKASVPLLSKLQSKYTKDLVIVGVTEPDSGANSPAAIRRFVKQQGPNMAYSVAIDRDGKTTGTYLTAAGAVGIPHAFLIGKDGKVAWQGSPLDPGMEEVITRMIAGNYDVSAAKVEQEVGKRMEKLSFLAQLGQWQGVRDGLVEILKLDPANEVALDALTDISIQELKEIDKFRDWIKSHTSTHGKNAMAMRRLAQTLMRIDDFIYRFPDLSLAAAKAAYTASDPPEAASITVYARALYQIGKLDRAIALQQDAVALADEKERPDVKGILDYYRTCKKLQGTVD